MTTKLHRKARGHQILFEERLLTKPEPGIFTKGYWRRRERVLGEAKGRGTTLFVKHESQVWVLRHYCRGGLIGRVLSDQFFFTGFTRSRAFQEFQLLVQMQELGLAVPTPVAAHVHRRGLIYRADLITSLIPNAADLHTVLQQRALNKKEWGLVGQAVAKLHNAQVYHHDLNIRNIMLDADQKVWIIDFDRCRQRSGSAWKQQNCDRLHRSLVKESGRTTPFNWQENDWAAFIKGYVS